MKDLKELKANIERIKKQADQKIEHLYFEYNTKNKFDFVSNDCDISVYDDRIVLEVQDLEDAKNILNKFKPTNETTNISASCKGDEVLNSPYRIDLKNPCTSSRFLSHVIQIEYYNKDLEIQIKIPVKLLGEFVSTSSRLITSSEHHYFTGLSHSELRGYKVHSYKFNNYNYVSWYGGTQTLKDIEEINNIIEFIKQ